MNMSVKAVACYDNMLEVHIDQSTYDKYSAGLGLRAISMDQGHVNLELEARDGGPKFEKGKRGGEVIYKWRYFFSGINPRPPSIPTFGMTKIHHAAEMADGIYVTLPQKLNEKRAIVRQKKGDRNGPTDQDASEDAFPLESELRFAKQIINQAKASFGEDMEIALNDDGTISIDITIRRRI